jgi:serine/threonine-protein kinase
MTPRSVSHYEIVEKLGEGGTGVVYKARDLKLDRFVALKFLSSHLLASQQAVQRFLQEARAISALNHPNIATIYAVEEEGGTRFLVLEYLPGGTLRSRIGDLRRAGIMLSWGELSQHALHVAAGLAHAHRHGIIHRDVKSGNIMFTEERAVKITDFGLAKYRGGLDITRSGTIAGTVAYMSPEQAQGLEVDHRSDVFSLGVVLYEMATRELPFQGPHEAAVLQAVIHAPTPALKGLRSDLPEAFEQIVLRATAKDREQRYRSMEELAGALRSLRGTLEPGAVYRASTDPTLTLSAPPAVAPLPRPRSLLRRLLARRAGALLAAALLLLLTLAVVFRERIGDWVPLRSLPAEKQLAVLPFTNVGSDPANQAFCDGLMETLSSKLSQMEQFQGSLRVVPATEVRREKLASARDALQIFGVNLVLSGSVQRSGDSVRLTVNLVDARTRRQLSSETIDTPIGDLAALQDGVFTRAAALLELELHPSARKTLSSGQTRVPTAYYAYLQGLGYLSRYDVSENVDRAVPLFRQAVQQDPNYALAYAGLGEACWRKFGETRDRQWAEEARTSCLRAVELDSRLAKVHVTLGLVYRGTGQFNEAVEQLQQALKIDPISPDAHRELAGLYEVMGKLDEAEATHRKAIELRPDYWVNHWDLAWFYYRRARYQQAEAEFRKVIQLVPDHARAYSGLGAMLHLQGRYDEAAAAFNKSLAIKPTPEAYSNLGTLYCYRGRYPEAVPMLEEAIRLGASNHQICGNLAEAYSATPKLAFKAPETYRRAIQLAEQQLAVNPKDARVRASLAFYLARLGQKQEALASIEQARRLDPKDRNILFRSALIYELTGDRDRALSALATAIHSGYSIAEIEGANILADLRKDHRYRGLLKGPAPR